MGHPHGTFFKENVIVIIYDRFEECEKDLGREDLINLMVKDNRQLYLHFQEVKCDEDGYLHWDLENWTTVDGGHRFIRSYGLKGRILADEFSGYNVYDMTKYFLPETADKLELA